MKSLNFESNVKQYCINGDENKVIEFDPADITILQRINEAQKSFSELKDIKPKDDSIEEVANTMEKLDNEIKKQIDYIFDSKISDIVFGNKSPLSTHKGVPLYERFLDSVMPEIKKSVESEKANSIKKMNKYTSVAKEFK